MESQLRYPDSILRSLRGTSQPVLARCSDDKFYAVKFRNNPQHRRVLVNEWLAAGCLRHLGLPTAETAVIEFGPAFLERNQGLRIRMGGNDIPIPPGRHFGSRFPADPRVEAVYDFLPDLLLDRVSNVGAFLGALVFDQWVGNTDRRQTVFHRWPLGPLPHPVHRPFVAVMIDHGNAFGGGAWRLDDLALSGLYHQKIIYSKVTGWKDFEPWIAAVVGFPEAVLRQQIDSIPVEWLDGDRSNLEGLIERLLARRRRVADLVENVRDSGIDRFPRWTRISALSALRTSSLRRRDRSHRTLRQRQ